MNEDQAPLERRADELRAELRTADNHQLAFVTDTSFREESPNQGFFELFYWGKPVVLPSEDFIARDPESNQALPPIHQALS